MCEPQKGRRKTFGFKPKGVNPAHDMAYSVLDSLPKGAAVNFVVQATLEFLKNHSGETITISGKQQFIVLGNYSCNNSFDNKALQPRGDIPDQLDETYTEAPSSVTEEIQGEEQMLPEEDPFSDLDEDTLSDLVMGFFSEN